VAKVERVKEVVQALRRRGDRLLRSSGRRAKGSRDAEPSVVVGYTQHYAIYVHENLHAHHPVGQAKYLEQPAREMAPQLGQLVTRAVRGGSTLAQAMLVAGLRLQRESILLVPVDTGALRASAFTELE
jgi:hypothetical protein